jgi:hypothetical protein
LDSTQEPVGREDRLSGNPLLYGFVSARQQSSKQILPKALLPGPMVKTLVILLSTEKMAYMLTNSLLSSMILLKRSLESLEALTS